MRAEACVLGGDGGLRSWRGGKYGGALGRRRGCRGWSGLRVGGREGDVGGR